MAGWRVGLEGEGGWRVGRLEGGWEGRLEGFEVGRSEGGGLEESF